MAEVEAAWPASVDASRVARVLVDGLVAGVLGAIAVALTHFLYDLSTGELLQTPAVLDALVFGEGSVVRAAPSAEAIARYSVLHLTLWMGVGVIASALISYTDSHPRVWPLVFGGAGFAFASLLFLAGAFSVPGLPQMHLWLGTILGAAALAAALATRHPNLVKHIERQALTDSTRRHMIEALRSERGWLAAAEADSAHFSSIAAFGGVAAARAERIQVVSGLFQTFDLHAPPEPKPGSDAPAASKEPADALAAAIAREREAVAFYDGLIVAEEEHRVRDVFLDLRYRSYDVALPELEASA